MLADDNNCKPKVLFRFSKSIDPNIAYSSWFRDNQTIKPKGKNAWNTTTNHITLDADFQPEAGDLKTTILKSLGVTSSTGIYFCDPRAAGWQEDLSERTLARLRALHDAHDVPYRYGEWRTMLAHFAS